MKKGIKYILNIPQINPIESLEIIQTNTQLTTVNFDSKDMGYYRPTDDSIGDIIQHIQKSPSITELNFLSWKLSKNNLHNLALMLQSNTVLTQLELNDNTTLGAIKDEGLMVIKSGLTLNRSLMDLRLIAQGMTNITPLTQALLYQPTLKRLDVSFNNLNQESVESITALLKINTTIIDLSLQEVELSNEGLDLLSQGLSACILKKLSLASNNFIQLETLATALSNHTSLVELDLSRNSFRSDQITWLAQIANCHSITHLNLSSIGLQDEGLKTLSGALATNTTIVQLNLSGNPFSNVEPLTQALATNQILKAINLSKLRPACTPIKYGYPLRDVGLIAEALKCNTTITCLKLNNGNIGNDGLETLLQGLAENISLKQLSLKCNKITNIKLLATALSLNYLEKLNLSLNNFDITLNANPISPLLKINTTLTYLKLNSCYLGSGGAKQLAEGLKGNSSLVQLHLSYNMINDLRPLTSALSNNESVEHLGINDPPCSDDKVQSVIQMLKTNTTIIRLVMPAQVFTAPARLSQINALLERNFNLYKIKINRRNTFSMLVELLARLWQIKSDEPAESVIPTASIKTVESVKPIEFGKSQKKRQSDCSAAFFYYPDNKKTNLTSNPGSPSYKPPF